MSDPHTSEALRRRYERIVQSLQAAEADRESSDRVLLRDSIIGLFRDTEALIAELEGLKQSIRPLVDRYRLLFPGVSTGGAQATGAGQRKGPSALDGAVGRRQEPWAGSAGSGISSAAAASQSHGESVRIDHLGSSTYLERGWNAIAGGSYGSAVGDLEKALSLAPGQGRAEALLGWALMRDGRTAEARSVLEALLARDPDNHLARANLGYVEMREGRFSDAVDRLSSARAAPDRTAALYAHLYLGMAYAEREMHEEAEALLTQALEMGPNLIEAYWELGRVRYVAGDLDGAAAAWRKGAETNRFSLWGEKCQSAAEQLAAGEPVAFS